MSQPRLLWIDVSDGCSSAVARIAAEEHFRVEVCSDTNLAQASARRFAAQSVCFEFEHPHAAQLRSMRDFKLANPSLPLLMLTTQHSETLAIWAFRARVWNYLVKPVPRNELRANFTMLASLVSVDHGPSRSMRRIGSLMPGDLALSPDRPHAPSLQAAVTQVERHCAEKIRQSAIAASCGMSSSAFSRGFKAEYGMTFSDYLMRFRIARACRLLAQGSHNATTAGLAVGFEDPSHFARAFRKLLGISPSGYQRQQALLQPKKQRRELARAIPASGAMRISPEETRRSLPQLARAPEMRTRATDTGVHEALLVAGSRR